MARFDRNDRFAGYTIIDVIGQGGMGTVYLAQHPRLPQRIALKVLNAEIATDDEFQRRFMREADVIARLDHPAIIGVSDRGEEAGQLWIAMPYIHGTDASRASTNPMSIERTGPILHQMANALDFAHSRRVLHRDVKPANILLAAPDVGLPERAVLTDFGIASVREASTRITRTGAFTATLAYASPEQLSGSPVDHRSDQYSLACTIFTLLAGRPPFFADNPAVVIAGHLSHTVPNLRTVRPDIPEPFATAIQRAMAKSPSDRFAGCGEFAVHALADTTVGLASRFAPTWIARPGPQPSEQSGPVELRLQPQLPRPSGAEPAHDEDVERRNAVGRGQSVRRLRREAASRFLRHRR